MASLGLLDEVINIILLLTFNKVDSANVNEKYAMKVANDYAYQKIRTAEEAVLQFESVSKKGKRNRKTRPAQLRQMFLSGVIQNTRIKPVGNSSGTRTQKQEMLARLEEGGD